MTLKKTFLLIFCEFRIMHSNPTPLPTRLQDSHFNLPGINRDWAHNFFLCPAFYSELQWHQISEFFLAWQEQMRHMYALATEPETDF